MRKLLTGFTVLAALAVAGTGYAANGVVDMSWDNCSPIVQDKTTTTAGVYSIYVSELGNDTFHRGHQVRVIYADQTASVPDAWRFDPVGCQGTAFVTLDHTAPAAVVKTCPSFSQTAGAVAVKNVDFTDVNDPYALTTMRVVVASGYSDGATAIPTTRYFLASFKFDHTFSVVGATTPGSTCGGFEGSVCFKLTTATYADAALVETSFDRAVAPGAPLFVTFNGPAGCGGVPAKPTTWGSIKGQYRH